MRPFVDVQGRGDVVPVTVRLTNQLDPVITLGRGSLRRGQPPRQVLRVGGEGSEPVSRHITRLGQGVLGHQRPPRGSSCPGSSSNRQRQTVQKQLSRRRHQQVSLGPLNGTKALWRRAQAARKVAGICIDNGRFSMKRTIALVAMVLTALGATTGTAAAAGASPGGESGACNMMQGEPGMATVMTSISDQGMAGMMGAHTASGCSMG